MSVVLADTEDTWRALFRQMGRNYVEPKLVLFSGAVHSTCSFARAAVGPFYCPADQKLYIDLKFYADLKNRFHAPGDFAQAYVIAHEVGHHVQMLLGISAKVHALRNRVSAAEANRLSVKLELQADCLAGVWAHHANRSGRKRLPTAPPPSECIGSRVASRQATSGSAIPSKEKGVSGLLMGCQP